MEYSKLVAVTGLPGLYELINSKTDGAIVRSLDDNSTKFASSRIHNFSHLESIEVFTTADNVNLVEIFYAMEKATGSAPDTKDNGAIKKYFEKVYPDIDFDRVYSSDLKKMANWFSILKDNNIEIKLSEREPEEENIPEEIQETKEEVVPEKKKEKEKVKEKKETPKKTASKKPAPKKDTVAKAPAKKALPEKKAVKKALPRKKEK